MSTAPESPQPHYHHAEQNPTGARLRALTLAAIGVVYGDIGTSPLYTIGETLGGSHGFGTSEVAVLGVLSLIVWTLVLVVVVKYLTVVLRADNKGEGGVLALLALLLERSPARRRAQGALILLGLFGTALLLGDGMITPAISVLGAAEGLKVVTPRFEPYVVGATIAILVALFSVQQFGTGRVGRMFGPVTVVWFVTIAVLGFAGIMREPRVLAAVNPWYAVRFFVEHGVGGFAVLGGVFLAVTGAEALYADIGHFGKKPIRLAFFILVFPALLLNYFGQGALLLREPEAIANPFYMLAPRWFLYPLLGIAIAAAIVASQALISGAFSLAQQCVSLGYTPRLTIVHTSHQEYGQIYVPEVNRILMIGTLAVVLMFRSAGALGAAYGIAVTGTMAITTILLAMVARRLWGWSLPRVIALTVAFLAFDLAFLGANVLKIVDGGWVPLAVALVFVALMTTWKRGRELLGQKTAESSMPLELLFADMERRNTLRVRGTAVFMTPQQDVAPTVLLHHLKHNKSLHERVVLLSVRSATVPAIPDAERLRVRLLGHGFIGIEATYGFMETADVPAVLELCRASHGVEFRPMETTYYLNRERVLTTGKGRMAVWRKQLFAFMSRNAQPATQFFSIPANRVVELGAQVEL